MATAVAMALLANGLWTHFVMEMARARNNANTHICNFSVAVAVHLVRTLPTIPSFKSLPLPSQCEQTLTEEDITIRTPEKLLEDASQNSRML